MHSFSFDFGTRDAFGCTEIPKDVFIGVLNLTHRDPIAVTRVSGNVYDVDALKCTSQGHRHYQIDFSDFRIPVGSRVTIRPHDVEHNAVYMTVVESPERMHKHPERVVDAVVELQRTVQELKEWVYWDEDTTDSEHDEPDEQ